MSLFQTSVLNKYLKLQDAAAIDRQYTLYKNYFHNTTIQQTILNSKEEEYQDGFLRALFVEILGYTLKPDVDFNLVRELKNVKDAKKADGAIVDNDNVLAVIELKGTDTINLQQIETQAFNYKNNQANCKYVITSNFQKIRFYIDNAIDNIEWDLFRLNKTQFELLYLCLHKQNIFKQLPATIKTESVTVEENVTKQLYKEYSQFRKSLFNNIVELNPTIDKLVVFKKTQKLLDRFLFLFFAEDRMLVPPNSVRIILDQWTNLKDMDAYVPLYNRFKLYFGYLNNGHKGKLHDIFAYNGGLFAADEILDNIAMDDSILYNATISLSNYDYNSEVDVNILGHIFEHSLTEIEELEKEITSPLTPLQNEKGTTKRKKDGVFYTPKYITKYIVENTVGTLCKNKKAALKLQEEDYHKLTKKAKKQLHQTLMQYKEWLLNITIIDPACGSGAFLNQALEFLIAEHKWISELEANITNSSIVFDIETTILENNIFGVDINEESVEIAKLSLWLRTAQKGRRLNSLNNNIKCGNSLIDDVNVAGEKAFNWQKQFPKIFRPKEKFAYHVVLTTHNSRTSQRMKLLGIVKGKPVELGLKEEQALTHIFKDIIIENNYKCLAYNICKDHVHLILVCAENELTGIVQKLKSVSSKLLNRWCMSHLPPPPMGHDPLEYNNNPLEYTYNPLEYTYNPLENNYNPLEHNNHLWSQKFFSANMDDWQLMELSNIPGHVYKATYTQNAIEYINYNRHKHQLPISAQLQKTIAQFVCTEDEAFTIEYEGGFDVVIGNPPYGAKLDEDEKLYVSSKYVTFSQNQDIYSPFYQKANSIISQNGIFGLITPVSWQTGEKYFSLRNYLKENVRLLIAIKLPYNVFADAYVDTGIYIYDKKNNNTNYISRVFEYPVNFLSLNDIDTTAKFSNLENSIWEHFDNLNLVLNPSYYKLDKLLNNDVLRVSEISKTIRGILPNEGAVVNIQSKDNHKKYFIGDVYRYTSNNKYTYVEYGQNLREKPNDYTYFIGERILIRRIINRQFRIMCNYFENEFVNKKDLYILKITDNKFSTKYVLSLINSSLFSYIKTKGSTSATKDDFSQLTLNDIRILPIKKISLEAQLPFINNVDSMLINNIELNNLSSQFQKLLTSKFPTLTINTKLEKWYTLTFAAFSKELIKQKIKLSLAEQNEWLTFFEQQQQTVLAIKNQIDKTDAEIDKMVYALYGLTAEEIKIVEGT